MRKAIGLGIVFTLLAGCQVGRGGRDVNETQTIEVDGTNRSFELYLPEQLPERAPLVVMLHGGFGTGALAQRAYGWDELAKRERFAVAYPNGLNRAWNVGGGCCGSPGRDGVNDVRFLEQVVKRVAELVPIDENRVYAAGMSNGAMMSYRLACDSKVFQAIGPVAGTMLGACDSPAPMSVIHLHGLEDTNVRFDGEPGEGFARIDGPPVEEVIESWRKVSQGKPVELVTFPGVGHEWPPGATERIWRFFVSVSVGRH